MSTAPQGWQTPKTTWQANHAPIAPDFNRIEGNIQAIEEGTRTLDPSQAPSGNAGTLRQFLDWFANRIKAITGASNWYDNPPTTLAAAKQHIDATTGIHGATSSATASRLVIRDAAGRAQFGFPAHDGDAVTYPVPVSVLKKAQGNATPGGNVNFAVHLYAFGSAYLSGTGMRWISRPSTGSGNIPIVAIYYNYTGSNQTITWDYLTSSGRPRIWAVVDDAGRIIAMWEAEDPVDPEEPDACPIGLTDAEGNSIIPTGGAVVRLQAPKPEQLAVVMDRLQRAPLPSRYPWRNPPPDAVPRLQCGLWRKALASRALEEPPDIRDAYSIRNPHRRDWYLQLWLRNASRVLHDHKAHTLIPLYQDMFRVDKRTGRLELA